MSYLIDVQMTNPTLESRIRPLQLSAARHLGRLTICRQVTFGVGLTPFRKPWPPTRPQVDWEPKCELAKASLLFTLGDGTYCCPGPHLSDAVLVCFFLSAAKELLIDIRSVNQQ